MRWIERCAAVAALLAILHPVSASAEARACAVAHVEGEHGRIRHDDVWRPLAVGALPAGEVRIETGPETRAQIACDDGVELTVGAGTTVDLERLIGEAGRERSVLLRLLEGVVGAVAPQRNWSRFDIQAPLAIASVRSTEWLVGHDPASGSFAFVRKGMVTVDPLAAGPPMDLEVGQGVDVTPTGVEGPRAWPVARIEQIGGRIGYGWR